MSDLKFKVGAASDGSFDVVMRNMIMSARKARSQIASEFETAGKSVGKETAKGVGAAESAMTKLRDSAQKTATGIRDPLVKACRDVGNEAKTDFDKMSARFNELARSAETSYSRIESAAKRAKTSGGFDGGGGGGDGGRFSRRVGYWGMRNFSPVTPTLSMGANIARDLARGAGVDFSLSSLFHNTVSQSNVAQQIANSAYNGGARVSSSELVAQSSAVADFAKIDRGQALSGLQEFTAKTGDLQTARDVIMDLAKVSKATGSDLGEMVSASGDVANILGDIPDKGKEVTAVMKAMAGQGKLGAIEIRDLATQMGKLGALSGRFKLDDSTSAIFAGAGMKSGTGQNIALMGVLAQAARQTGGRITAAQASQSAMAFIRDFSSESELKRLSAAGINPYTDKTRTTINDPKKLIMAILAKTGGDQAQLAHLLPNQSSRSIVNSFVGDYTRAGGGKTGLDAVSSRFDKIAKSSMSDSEINESFRLALEQPASKAQDFTNKLQVIVDKMATEIIPSLANMAPKLEGAASHVANFVSWAAGHPWEAAGVALAASVAKAGLEQTLRRGVEKLFESHIGGVTAGALAVTAAAVTVYDMGKTAIDEAANREAGEDRQGVNASLEADAIERSINRKTAAGIPLSPDERAAAELKARSLKQRVDTDIEDLGNGGNRQARLLGGAMTGWPGFTQAAMGVQSVWTGEDTSGGSVGKVKELQAEEYQKQVEELRLHRRALEGLTKALERNGRGAPRVDDGARASQTR